MRSFVKDTRYINVVARWKTHNISGDLGPELLFMIRPSINDCLDKTVMPPFCEILKSIFLLST